MGVAGWSLEVVRGKEIGRSYPVVGSETVLGNALDGAKGIDLALQEGDSARRMAPRQAVIATSEQGLFLRDLDSPGGTFVNRQRLLPGQSRLLCSGDLIQLGAVQLHLVEAGSAVDSLRHVHLFSYQLKGGLICRSWDDFLRVASQKWTDLRDELSTGRIDGWLTSIRRTDLIISAQADASADDRLDAWLGQLPSTQPATAEMEVHPKRLLIRVIPGGGTTLRSVQVANVGHRLLRMSARIEPKETRWIKVADASSGRVQTVIDSYNLPLEVSIPDRLPGSMTATLVIDGNGGSQRVDLILEAKSLADGSGGATSQTTDVGVQLHSWIRAIPLTTRSIALALGGVLLRMVVGVSSAMPGPFNQSVSNPETPRLPGVVVVFATVFALLAGVTSGRRGGAGQVAFGLISGAVSGAAFAAIMVAFCRAIEPLLGGWSTSPLAVDFLWSLIGFGLAALSMVLVPVRSKRETG